MNAKAQQVIRKALTGLLAIALAITLAACSQSSPTDIVAAEECVLIRDQIYCP